MKKLLDTWCRLLDGLTALMLALMVVLVFGNVVLRYVFNSGITESEEFGRWLFVWLTFMGAVVALQNHAHLGTDMLISRLGAIGRRVCLVISQLAMLGITGLLFTGSLAQVRINAEVLSPVSELSMGIFYASGVVFAVSAAAVLLHQLWRTLSGAPDERRDMAGDV